MTTKLTETKTETEITLTPHRTRLQGKTNYVRFALTLKEDDPLVPWLESKILIGDKATATAITRILRRMATLEQQGRVPAEF